MSLTYTADGGRIHTTGIRARDVREGDVIPRHNSCGGVTRYARATGPMRHPSPWNKWGVIPTADGIDIMVDSADEPVEVLDPAGRETVSAYV